MLAVTIDHLLQNYGYLAVFLAIAAESFGIPLPGETVLITAALYAGHTHRLGIVWVVVVASAAAIIGDNLGYLIGRVGGYRLLRRYGKYVRMDEAKIKIGRYLFHRHGGKVVLFGRFVSVLRTYAAFLAGTNRMQWQRFLVYNALGGIMWATLFGVGAYAVGGRDPPRGDDHRLCGGRPGRHGRGHRGRPAPEAHGSARASGGAGVPGTPRCRPAPRSGRAGSRRRRLNGAGPPQRAAPAVASLVPLFRVHELAAENR